MTQNEKIDGFVAKIINDSKQESFSLFQKIEEEKNIAVELGENQLLAESYRKIKESVEQIRANSNKKLALRQSELKNEFYTCRNEFAKEFFAILSERLENFTDTPEYKQMLIKLAGEASAALKESKVILYLRKKDLIFGDDILRVLPAGSVFSEGDFEKGGFVIDELEGRMHIDESFDILFNEQKSKFAELLGRSKNE